ncbi:MAG: glycosyltransferase family 39 protein [Ignavibacteria bacterium]|nr:glycosyltransferase family 39 protein [Ignavibacteria bacterium]
MTGIIKYLDDGKKLKYFFAFLVVFLFASKIHTIIVTDIQPWDEGMYAARVLSIKDSGDILDQSQHSIGKFYSGSHPPLLIWTGYIFTSIFGMNNVSFKIFIFLLSIALLWFIVLFGKKVYDNRIGMLAAIIFSSNIIFSIFCNRFQFDIPYSLLIIISFYYVLKYEESGSKKYNIYAGIFFGLCLMVKILVGFFIPMVLFFVVILSGRKFKYSISDLFVLTSIGVIIAAPWHIYMFAAYGSEFANYFFFYHIYERALFGVEQNTKGSGYLYHINYLLTILPYGVIFLFGAAKQMLNIKKIQPKELFILIWFMMGLLIITFFRTKLEVYIMLILLPGVFIASNYVRTLASAGNKEKILLLTATAFNIFWSVLNYFRIEEGYKIQSSNINTFILLSALWVLISAVLIFFIMKKRSGIPSIYYGFILVFLIFVNLLYAVRIPYWENSFKITDIKGEIEKSGNKNLIYVASNRRANPQFSFYFDGLDIGWKTSDYKFELLDTKDGTENIKEILKGKKEACNIIVEKDKINRSEYPESSTFIPEGFILIKKSPGYELYRNNWK